MSFPEAEADAEADACAAHAATPAEAPLNALAARRVLIIDDHPANRIVLDGQLRLLGASTRLASMAARR